MSPTEARPPLRVALVQFKPTKADVAGNVQAVCDIVGAHADQTDLIVFPETALSGYFLEGGVAEAALTVEQLIDMLGPPPAGGPDVVIGFYERWRRRLHNSAVYLGAEEGAWAVRHVHRKMFLPTYGVFDEERFLDRGHALASFATRFGRAALLICEDFWHTVTATTVALQGAEIVYVPSASPARGFGGDAPANVERWAILARAVSGEHGLYVALASLVGSEAGKLMSGGSLIAGPAGEVLAQAPAFEEAVLVADVDLDRIPPLRYDNPMLADLKAGLPLIFPELRRRVEEL